MGNHLLANQSDGRQHLTLVADNVAEQEMGAAHCSIFFDFGDHFLWSTGVPAK
jgi:hypothetical protein